MALMNWALIVAAANVFLAIGVAALWVSYIDSRKAKRQNREPAHMREEIEIDPDKVPQFKPTWRNLVKP